MRGCYVNIMGSDQLALPIQSHLDNRQYVTLLPAPPYRKVLLRECKEYNKLSFMASLTGSRFCNVLMPIINYELTCHVFYHDSEIFIFFITMIKYYFLDAQ